MNQIKKNTFFSHIAALLFLLMLFRYRAIFVLLTDFGSNIYSILIVVIFYLLNIVAIIGLFLTRRWGYITSYFAIPLSTFLFATSYLFFISDWIPAEASKYIVPFLNALFLIWVASIHAKRRRLLW